MRNSIKLKTELIEKMSNLKQLKKNIKQLKTNLRQVREIHAYLQSEQT